MNLPISNAQINDADIDEIHPPNAMSMSTQLVILLYKLKFQNFQMYNKLKQSQL